MVAQTVTYSDISNRSIGLGIAVVVTGLIAGIILQLTRRIRRMPAYFIANFEFFKNRNPKLPIIATVFYYILLLTPVILLIVWVIILGVNVGPNPALPVLFIGIFIGLIFVPFTSRFFYFKILAMLISYVAAEALALGLVFLSESQTSFWTLTALSMTLNCLAVIIAVWFLDQQAWSIPEDVPQSLKEKIIGQVKIWKKIQEPPQIIDDALYGRVVHYSKPIRYTIVIITYIFGLVILAIYSVIGLYRTIFKFQALVNSVAIVTTDIIVFMLLIISKKIGLDPNLNSLIIIAMRVCIVAFSGPFWFFGYCLLYLILMIYISILIINKYYPLFEKPPIAEVVKINIFKMPEIPGLLLLLMFSALVYFIGVDQKKNLPINEAQIGEAHYPFWAIGVSAILLSLSVFFYLITLRIIERSRQKIRSTSMYYLGCQGCSQYYVFIFAAYAFLVILGFYLYSAVGKHLIWTSCVFLPLFYQSFIIFCQNWAENDYLILGDVTSFNKKIKKRQQRQQKIIKMRNSVISKMKEQDKADQQDLLAQQANLRVMDNAKVQQNWVLDNYQINSGYSQWRDDSTFFQAFKAGKLLPTDKRIVISIPIMAIILVAYSLTFFFTQQRDMTAFTVSVELLVLYLIFVPTKRYFSTFEMLNVLQIVSFVLGIVINYTFGVISYALDWNKSSAYTVLWTVINPLLVTTYAAIQLIQDKGIVPVTIIINVVSMVFSFGPGIILLAWFRSTVVGIVLIGAGFYYSYFMATIIIYKKMNNSVPFVIYPITVILIVLTCFAIMVYSFIDDNFDNFYGFSITYLVINLLILFYATYRVVSDILTRLDKPNFYSPYGAPAYKYDSNIRSAVENMAPLKLWIASWFMFYIYTILMQIFLQDTNYGTATSMIPLLVLSLSLFYVITYNAYHAGKVSNDITPQILEISWEYVVQAREKNLGNFLNIDELQKQIQNLKKKQDEQGPKPEAVKINPKDKNKNDQSEMNQTTTKIDPKKDGQTEIEIDMSFRIYDLQNKIAKAVQNDKILLVNFWTYVIFKTQSNRKRKMIEFVSFIKDCGDILASAGIALILNDSLYDLELTYNQAFQQLHTLSAIQRVFFNKELKKYLQRKVKQNKQKQDVHNKQVQIDKKRQKELQNKILNDKNDDDSNLPIQKMKDGPAKLKKLKQTIKTEYTDNDFKTVIDIIPNQVRSLVKGWKRPSKNSVVMKNNLSSAMQVRQGSIGDCYLISAIGVLGKDRVRQIITDPSQCPPGVYMVKFKNFGKDIYVLIDDNFPVIDSSSQNNWTFGRCEDNKQIFCNIIEKAYAKLYGGYDKIVGGKVSLALSVLTGGFPQQIQLKKYQQTNTNQIFDKMVEFKKAGYLMGAGSPPNPRGDAALIDGIYQGHAYLIIDVRNLDGNKLIKLRNPHGNQSKESTLDWSDNSSKWTSRLKGLLGQSMGEDGAFWISLDDFIYAFRALYVCRIFDSSWKRVGPFRGQWKGISAAGLKSDSGSVILKNNPHYGIKVYKACTIFIELNQNEIAKDGTGKNQIFFMVQRNSGKRIDAPATNKLAGMSGPAINSRTISKEISLTADAFPYTFSLMVSTYMAGSEGSYNLTMYCNDPSIQIIEDSTFGR